MPPQTISELVTELNKRWRYANQRARHLKGAAGAKADVRAYAFAEVLDLINQLPSQPAPSQSVVLGHLDELNEILRDSANQADERAYSLVKGDAATFRWLRGRADGYRLAAYKVRLKRKKIAEALAEEGGLTEYGKLAADYSRLDELRRKAEAARDALQQELAKTAKDLFNERCDALERNQRLRDAEKAQDSLAEEQAARAQLHQKLLDAQNQLLAVDGARKDVEKDLDRVRNDLKTAHAKLLEFKASSEKELERVYSERDEAWKELDSLRVAHGGCRVTLADREDALRVMRDERDEAQRALAELREKRAKIGAAQQRARKAFERAGHATRPWWKGYAAGIHYAMQILGDQKVRVGGVSMVTDPNGEFPDYPKPVAPEDGESIEWMVVVRAPVPETTIGGGVYSLTASRQYRVYHRGALTAEEAVRGLATRPAPGSRITVFPVAEAAVFEVGDDLPLIRLSAESAQERP